MNEKQAAFVAKAPETVKKVLTLAFENKSSPRQAIKAKCLDCCHFDRSEIASCTVVLCPLHAYRPFQFKNARASEPTEDSGQNLAS